MGTRLQTLSDIHKRDLQALERALIKRVETAERLCNLVLFEQERAKRQIRALCQEVAELREDVRRGGSSDGGKSVEEEEESGSGRTDAAAGWIDLDGGGVGGEDDDGGYDV